MKNIKKEVCELCKDLPEGEVVIGHDHRIIEITENEAIKAILILLEKWSRQLESGEIDHSGFRNEISDLYDKLN